MYVTTARCRWLACWCGFLAAASPACRVIDACEDPRPAPIAVLYATEQPATVAGTSAVAPLPNGGSILVYSSQLPGQGAPSDVVVRLAHIGADGHSSSDTCARLGPEAQPVLDYEGPRPDVREFQHSAAVQLGPAPGDEGLLVFLRSTHSKSSTPVEVPPTAIKGLFLDSDGCPNRSPTSFDIPVLRQDVTVESPTVVRIGKDQQGNDDFLIFWLEHSQGATLATQLRASAVRDMGVAAFQSLQGAGSATVTTLPTASLRLGPGPVAVLVSPRTPARLAVVALSWFETTLAGQKLMLELIDEQGSMVSAPVVVAPAASAAATGTAHGLAMATSGDTFAIVWSQDTPRSVRTLSAIHMSLFAVDGAPLPDRQDFLVSNGGGQGEDEPSVSPLSGGGFLVTWTTSAPDGSDGNTSGIMAAGFGTTGTRLFSHAACSQAPFSLAAQSSGRQYSSSSTRLSTGSVLVGWTFEALNGLPAVYTATLKRTSAFSGK